jgi:hypothetical protein
MRKKNEIKIEHYKFLHESRAEKMDNIGEIEDLHKYVRPINWPISKEQISPSMADGSAALNKNMSICLKEREWNSIDRHVKALDRNKSEWIRYAMLRLIQEEQLYCFKHKKDEER